MNASTALARLNAIMGSNHTNLNMAISVAQGCVEEAFIQEDAEEFLSQLKTYWPRYIAYLREQERDFA